jgi:murein DD-endopeptidase MepM/ murein hydrolase activator NlpD
VPLRDDPSAVVTRPRQGTGRHVAPRVRVAATAALLAAGAALVPGTAVAGSGTSSSAGGVTFVETPTIDSVACKRRCASHGRLQGGSTVRISGRSLSDVTEAVFHGGSGTKDDMRTSARPRGARRLDVRVPRRALSGPVSVRTSASVESQPTSAIDILPPLPPEALASKSHVFPVRGAHDYGGEGAQFGSGRAGHGHQGHDVFAACGTPLVAARGGKVQFRGYHGAAGHHVVIDGDGTGMDYAYMHLEQRSPFRAGDRVGTGQQIGTVGDSGNARGCHLHFELWTAPGWYDGGRPVDPLRALKAWDAWS